MTEVSLEQGIWPNQYRQKPLLNNVNDILFADESTDLPVTLAEAKAWALLETTDFDSLVTALIDVARQQCEDFTGISIITRNVTVILSNSNGNIYLPYGPVQTDSGQSVVLYDKDDAIITDAIIRGLEFPYIESPACDYIKAVYNAGYDVIPEKIKAAIKAQVAYLFENRGDAQAMATLSPIAQTILKPISRK
jgi:hypothetical protein